MELNTLRNRWRKGSSLQTGLKTELIARSLGACLVRQNNILTPVNDRFPPQAFDLKVKKFVGITASNSSPNFSWL